MKPPVELETRCGECLLYAALQGMSDGIILVDHDERIFHLNRRAQEILELGSRHVIGTRLRGTLRHVGLASFWAAAAEEEVPASTDLAFPGGLSIRASVSLCLSAARDPIGRMLLLRDVTREKRVAVDLSDSVARRLVQLAGGEGVTGPLAMLTPREREVLSLLAEGLTNAGIAARLRVSLNTVASHLKSVYPKLGVRGRAQAAAYAVTNGLFPGSR
ncbi:MAG TPA: LuxR C-terminal-related transcriptional regulator [Candidatus Polarisedimenticolia bacterium]|nr:LuxR C-terminal-related transcriptional regulator [Candidatus Polarisedimenticolia bacterium]